VGQRRGGGIRVRILVLSSTSSQYSDPIITSSAKRNLDSQLAFALCLKFHSREENKYFIIKHKSELNSVHENITIGIFFEWL
jgi:hypothetical protein